MKRYLFSLAAVLCLSSGAGITAVPGGSYILENRFFRVTVSPESGGRIISFKDTQPLNADADILVQLLGMTIEFNF